MNSNYFETKIIQIELSSHCNLACPGCGRVGLIKSKKLKNFSISVEEFKKIVNDDSGINTIIFSGAISDIIYYKHLFEILEYVNSLEKRPFLWFSTNGSGKNEEWWTKFGKLLRSTDEVCFAIDGLEDTNPIYRVNSKWPSIITGIESLKKINQNLKINWVFCVFEHNYHQVRSAYDISKSLGIGFRVKLGDFRTPQEMKLKSVSWKAVIDQLKQYEQNIS